MYMPYFGIIIRHSFYRLIRETNGQIQIGTSCSKLTTSLVNVSLKFKTKYFKSTVYFLLEKCEKSFALQKIFTFKKKIYKKQTNRGFDNVVGIYEGCQKSSWTPSLPLNRNND